MCDKENNTLCINTPKANHLGYFGYKTVRELNKGESVSIMLCLCMKTEQYRVLKVIHFQDNDERRHVYHSMYENERKSLVQLKGVDGIVQLYDHFQFHNGTETHLVLVMEYLHLENQPVDMMQFLEDKLERDPTSSMGEEDTKHIMKSLIDRLLKCKRRGIMHKDIKLENIMIRDVDDIDMEVVLIDFGLSDPDWVRQKRSNSTHGTLYYLSPLEIQQKSHDIEKSDVFSLGVVCFCLLFFRFPGYKFIQNGSWYEFWAYHEQVHVDSKPDQPLPSEECKDFMECMLQWNEMDRDSLDELAAHPFLQM